MSENNTVKLTDRQQEVVRAIMKEGVAYERTRIIKLLQDRGTKMISVAKLIELIQEEV